MIQSYKYRPWQWSKTRYRNPDLTWPEAVAVSLTWKPAWTGTRKRKKRKKKVKKTTTAHDTLTNTHTQGAGGSSQGRWGRCSHWWGTRILNCLRRDVGINKCKVCMYSCHSDFCHEILRKSPSASARLASCHPAVVTLCPLWLPLAAWMSAITSVIALRDPVPTCQ